MHVKEPNAGAGNSAIGCEIDPMPYGLWYVSAQRLLYFVRIDENIDDVRTNEYGCG